MGYNANEVWLLQISRPYNNKSYYRKYSCVCKNTTVINPYFCPIIGNGKQIV